MTTQNSILFKSLIIGCLMYQVHGIFYMGAIQNYSYWWSYPVTAVICITMSYLMLTHIKSGSATIIVVVTTILINTHLTVNSGVYSDLEMIFSIALILSIMEFTWMLSKTAAFLINSICLFFACLTFYRVAPNTNFHSVALIPFVVVFTWKLTMAYFQNKAYKAKTQLDKLSAYKSTITRLNHEFNNASMVLVSSIHLLKKQCKCDSNKEEFEKLSKSIHHFSAIITQLNETDLFEEEDYSKKQSMVKIGKEE